LYFGYGSNGHAVIDLYLSHDRVHDRTMGGAVVMAVVGMFGAEAMLSSTGVPLSSVPVTILTVPGGANATCYADLTGSTGGTGPPYNPVMTSTTGDLTFYAVPAQYDLVIGGSTVARVIINVTGQSVGTVGGPAGPLTSSGLVPAAQIPATATKVDYFNVEASPYNATGNSTTDDTTAIQNALADVHTYGGVLYLPARGGFKTTAPLNITKTGVSVEGPGSSLATLLPTNNGDCIRLQIASFVPSVSCGTIKGIRIDGTNAGPSACGIHFGDAMNGAFDDVDVFNFAGVGGVGVHADNVTQYTEGWDWGRMNVVNNTTGVLFDVNAGGSPAGISNSFGYHRIRHLRIDANSGQVGVILRNGALLYNGVVCISANLASGATLMEIQGVTGVGRTAIANAGLDIQAEVTGGGSANGIMLSQYGAINGQGVVDLSSGTITSSVGAGPNFGSFGVTGWVRIPGAIGVVWFGAAIASTATGGSATLPANPVGFLELEINGAVAKIPYWAA
jgi:hypothetical protein